MYKVHRISEGWVILYHEGDTSRPVDGGHVYPHKQNAYRRCKKMNKVLEEYIAFIARDGANIV